MLMALVFYNRGMFEKVTLQRTQQLDFSKSKDPVKCNAYAVAQKIETDCHGNSTPTSQNARINTSICG